MVSQSFPVEYLALMACIVLANTFALCRRQQTDADESVREILVWTGCFLLLACIDFIITGPGVEYFITPN